MKIGAGIAGIFLGSIALLYVGLFGGMVGSAAGWLGSLGPGSSAVTNWATVVSIISWVAPLLAIVGGIVTFSHPRAGGLLLAASACLLWYLLGIGMIGKIFVLPIAAAAVLGWIAGSSNSDTASGQASPASPQALPAEPASTTSPPRSELMPAAAGFDRGRWDALAKYDPDIAPVVERVRPLGQKWIDELATSYLALNDKTYLASIEQKIAAAAKAEADELEIRNARAESERKTQAEEQEHRVQEQLLERERLADAQLRRQEELREKNWGTPRAKLKTLAIAGVPLLGAALIWLAAVYWNTAQQEKDYHAALTDLSDTEITLLSDKVNAQGEGIHEWRGWVTRNMTTTIVGGPADSTRAFNVAGALSAAFSRSKLGDCESQLLLGVSKLADAQFKCSAWPFLAWKINKSPHSRLASLTVSFAGAVGNDKFVAPAGAQYQLYALDLQGATTRLLARGSFASVVAISPLGDRALAVLPDGVHVFDLVSGRDFVDKANHSSAACAGLEASFTNDQGTQFQVRQKSAEEMQVVPLDPSLPVYRPASDSVRPCPVSGRYDVNANGLIFLRGPAKNRPDTEAQASTQVVDGARKESESLTLNGCLINFIFNGNPVTPVQYSGGCANGQADGPATYRFTDLLGISWTLQGTFSNGVLNGHAKLARAGYLEEGEYHNNRMVNGTSRSVDNTGVKTATDLLAFLGPLLT